MQFFAQNILYAIRVSATGSRDAGLVTSHFSFSTKSLEPFFELKLVLVSTRMPDGIWKSTVFFQSIYFSSSMINIKNRLVAKPRRVSEHWETNVLQN